MVSAVGGIKGPKTRTLNQQPLQGTNCASVVVDEPMAAESMAQDEHGRARCIVILLSNALLLIPAILRHFDE